MYPCGWTVTERQDGLRADANQHTSVEKLTLGHQQGKEAEPATPQSTKTLKGTKVNLDATSRSNRKSSLEEKIPNLGQRAKTIHFHTKNILFPYWIERKIHSYTIYKRST